MLADFSSRGPGVSVISTVPGFVHNHNNPSDYKYVYERISGTLMGTANVAIISALLLQAKPDLQPEVVKAILMNTADPLSKTYSVFEVGAERVDPYNAPNNYLTKKKKENNGVISFGNKAFDGKLWVD
ncbi:S8 family serine peptidase [Gottfriedia sp. NPDC057948]|uniref:S8 family serine peptidase n=1 Tax=Gottfriedia sp. NPDC057948 TaxID=3346287 RepID=UPI0036D9678C